ncbi:MAG: peptidoglycan-associated lipoprotein Pal [Lysobacter sp.]|nr:peptidoglycan-associated lipoprotein Pal [Lysobacter sp.]
MNATTRVLMVAMLCTAAVACSKKVKEEPVQPPPPSTTAPIQEPPAAAGAYTPEDLDTDACLRTRVVYFDFDQDALRPEFQAAMACHAKYLRDRPSARMSLEGNADERGSREYNLGLGERRGNAVSSALQANGGSGSQITVVSYGEERPTCNESTEDCWAKNRRVEIVYTAK